jgi:hypothetical protein
MLKRVPVTVLLMYIILSLFANMVTAAGDPQFGACSRVTGIGACRSGFFACEDSCGYWTQHSDGSWYIAYDCWCLDNCQESYCYYQCAPTGSGCSPLKQGGPEHRAPSQKPK